MNFEDSTQIPPPPPMEVQKPLHMPLDALPMQPAASEFVQNLKIVSSHYNVHPILLTYLKLGILFKMNLGQ